MLALIWRECAGVARTGAYWAAGVTYVALLALFLIVWGDGMPIAGGGSNWQQFVGLQWAALIVALPWIAARCHRTSRRELTRLAIATARPPSQLITARCLAHALLFFVFALFALPMTAVMRQVAAVTVADAAATLLPMLGLVAFVAVVTTGTMLCCATRVAGWAVAAVVTGAVAAALPQPHAGAWWLLLAALASIPLLLVADARLAYLPGESA